MTQVDAVIGAARAVAVAFALIAAPGFAAGEPEAHDDRVAVVATTTIVGNIVARVGGDRLSLYVMLPLGADPHAFQATPGTPGRQPMRPSCSSTARGWRRTSWET